MGNHNPNPTFNLRCRPSYVNLQSLINSVSLIDRFIQACNAFQLHTISMKLAIAFVLSRLLKVNNEQSWINIFISCLSNNFISFFNISWHVNRLKFATLYSGSFLVIVGVFIALRFYWLPRISNTIDIV